MIGGQRKAVSASVGEAGGLCRTRRRDGYPDRLGDEFSSRPIERPGRLYELSRNGESHLRVPLWPEFYPSRNTALVGVVKLRLFECGRDNLLLRI